MPTFKALDVLTGDQGLVRKGALFEANAKRGKALVEAGVAVPYKAKAKKAEADEGEEATK